MLAELVLILTSVSAQSWDVQRSGGVESLRGVSVVNKSIVWASGTGGTYLRTVDGGSHWHSGVVPNASKLDFRGVHAFSRNHAILMSSGKGDLSTLYETRDGGNTWTLMLRDPDGEGFFDALAFAGAKRGFVLGDPVNGRFVLLRTSNGGGTWNRTGFTAAPEGEGAFAASNSSIALVGKKVWLATGGKGGARVALTTISGPCCEIVQTPLRHDADGAGIFSIAFANGAWGIAVGGDYSKPAEVVSNCAVTHDGGRTWRAPRGTPPRGYRSSVVWLAKPRTWIATGPTGSEVSADGENWTAMGEKGFNALGVGPGDACWAVGNKGVAAKLVLSKATADQTPHRY